MSDIKTLKEKFFALCILAREDIYCEAILKIQKSFERQDGSLANALSETMLIVNRRTRNIEALEKEISDLRNQKMYESL